MPCWNLANIGSSNGLFPDGNKPTPGIILTTHQRAVMVFTLYILLIYIYIFVCVWVCFNKPVLNLNFNEHCFILKQTLQKFTLTDGMSWLDRIIASRQTGDTHYLKQLCPILQTHIWDTRPTKCARASTLNSLHSLVCALPCFCGKYGITQNQTKWAMSWNMIYIISIFVTSSLSYWWIHIVHLLLFWHYIQIYY